jgi:hypothetical protein
MVAKPQMPLAGSGLFRCYAGQSVRLRDGSEHRIPGFEITPKLLIEHAQQLTSKCLIDKIVGQERGAQQSTQLREGFVQRIASHGSAKTRQHLNCTGVPAVHRGDEVHDLLPMRLNLCQIDIGAVDRSQDLRNVPAMRQKQETGVDPSILSIADTDQSPSAWRSPWRRRCSHEYLSTSHSMSPTFSCRCRTGFWPLVAHRF